MNNFENTHEDKLAYVKQLYKDEKYEEAIQICNDIIFENEDCFFAYSQRSYSFHALGRNQDAFDDIEKLIELRPTCPVAYMRRARFHLERGDDDLALADANFVIELEDEYFIDTAYFYQAVSLLNLGRSTEALAAYQMLPDDYRDYLKTYNVFGKLISKSDLHDLIKKGGKL
jgi:tetratricopeptide (TPR) repeat protein